MKAANIAKDMSQNRALWSKCTRTVDRKCDIPKISYENNKSRKKNKLYVSFPNKKKQLTSVVF